MTWTRGRVVLLIMIGAAVALVAALLPWATVTVVDAAGSTRETLTGTSLVPAVTAAGLAALAGGGALTLADGWGRRVIAVVVLACGAAVTFTPIDVLLDPATAIDGQGVTTSIGIPPWVAAAAGLVVCTGAALALLHGERWPRRAPRRRDGAAAPSDWDRLSAGDDPT
ncbi:MAG: Trp biosynthesis-associated membrane protein [Mobilicoccus sp.]|nr:Trp biosynthesis-associated membrane protein [Mobilicoccus sp.]